MCTNQSTQQHIDISTHVRVHICKRNTKQTLSEPLRLEVLRSSAPMLCSGVIASISSSTCLGCVLCCVCGILIHPVVAGTFK